MDIDHYRSEEAEIFYNYILDSDVDHIHIVLNPSTEPFFTDIQDSNLLNGTHTTYSIYTSTWDPTNILKKIERSYIRKGSWITKLKRHVSIRLLHLGLDFKNDLPAILDSSSEDVFFVQNSEKSYPETFSWIDELGTSENVTYVTRGYDDCNREHTKNIIIGKLKEEKAVEYLSEKYSGHSTTDFEEILTYHDYHIPATEIALKKDDPLSELTGEELKEIWEATYENQLSSDEKDLISKCFHLLDLNTPEVSEMSEIEEYKVEDTLRKLKEKQLIHEVDSADKIIYKPDEYVLRYFQKISKKKRLLELNLDAAHIYAKLWENEIKDKRSKENEEYTFEEVYTMKNLILSVHHLTQSVEEEVSHDKFIEIVLSMDLNKPSKFLFGLFAQRFLFSSPEKIIPKLHKELYDVEDESLLTEESLKFFMEGELLTAISELEKGWTNPQNTTGVDINRDLEENNSIPQVSVNTNTAIARFWDSIFLTPRESRKALMQFSKTAENAGLTEEIFTEFVEELMVYLEMYKSCFDKILSESGNENHRSESEIVRYNGWPNYIQDRTDIEERFEENNTLAQKKLERGFNNLSEKSEELFIQCQRCGDVLEKSDNPIFKAVWYKIHREYIVDFLTEEYREKIIEECGHARGRRKEYEKFADYNDSLEIIEEELL